VSSAQESTASLHLDVEARVASIGASRLNLTGQEFDLLVALTARPVVSREDLRRAINLRGQSPRRVDGILVRLRRVLGPHAIRTVRGRGWMLQIDYEVH
jgi:DNA-binding response OmpR family regulator